jgi:heme oxygenase
MQSQVLARLEHATRPRHGVADQPRLALVTPSVTVDAYRGFLMRIYGFEAPVESAIAMTPGLDALLDLRTRTSMRLLRSDLLAIGVADPAQLPRCTSVFPFNSAANALGWVYVVERNAMLHGILLRHFEQRLPGPLRKAGAYLAGNERAVGSRMRELGHALDGVARTHEVVDRIVVAAQAAFRCQQHWFAEVVPPRREVP